jgi:hypothetical protein
MNQQIREFEKESGLAIFGLGAKTHLWEAALEKFAYLVAKDCAGIVQNLSPGYDDYRNQIEDSFRTDCVAEIERQYEIDPGWKKLEFPEI